MAYGFEYDAFDRLTKATSALQMPDASGTPTWEVGQKFDAEYQYDLEGNLTFLERWGITDLYPTLKGMEYEFELIDDLEYEYDAKIGANTHYLEYLKDVSNQPEGITASGVDYAYDGAGNLVQDDSKGLSASYNYLNLPESITLTSDSYTITYDAQGRKLKQVTNSGTRYYLGGIEYNATDDAVEFSFEEGRVYPDQDTIKPYLYEYALTDHLGNIRVLFQDRNQDGNVRPEFGEVLQEHHYYPFGMEWGPYYGNAVVEGPWQWHTTETPDDAHRYRYNGKEWNGDGGLNWLDYGARWYDGASGRWNAVDPLAADYTGWSPYNYVLGNPVRLVDPDGEKPEDIIVIINKDAVYGAGHVGLLIGDDKSGWTYISKDGRADTDNDGNQNGTILSGGESRQTVLRNEFNTLDDALNDERLSAAYDEGYRLETTPEQDEKAIEVATEDAKSKYSLFSSSCADTCTKTLESVGFDGGGYQSDKKLVGVTYSDLPIERYNQIVKNNPEGELIQIGTNKRKK